MWFTAPSANTDLYPNTIAVLFPAQQNYYALCTTLFQQSLDAQGAVLNLHNALWQSWLNTNKVVNHEVAPQADFKVTAEPVVEVTEDLTAISGIGPVIADKLTASGIHSYQQIADWTEQDIEAIETTIMAGRLAGRIRRDDWVGQARELSDG